MKAGAAARADAGAEDPQTREVWERELQCASLAQRGNDAAASGASSSPPLGPSATGCSQPLPPLPSSRVSPAAGSRVCAGGSSGAEQGAAHQFWARPRAGQAESRCRMGLGIWGALAGRPGAPVRHRRNTGRAITGRLGDAPRKLAAMSSSSAISGATLNSGMFLVVLHRGRAVRQACVPAHSTRTATRGPRRQGRAAGITVLRRHSGARQAAAARMLLLLRARLRGRADGAVPLATATAGSRSASRVLVPELVVKVLDRLLQDVRADFGKLDLAQLRLREGACVRQ